MTPVLFFDFTSGYEEFHNATFNDILEPSRIKRKKANIFIKIKWFILISLWKFNNRKWIKCRHKTKALNKYKETLMKGYWV